MTRTAKRFLVALLVSISTLTAVAPIALADTAADIAALRQAVADLDAELRDSMNSSDAQQCAEIAALRRDLAAIQKTLDSLPKNPSPTSDVDARLDSLQAQIDAINAKVPSIGTTPLPPPVKYPCTVATRPERALIGEASFSSDSFAMLQYHWTVVTPQADQMESRQFVTHTLSAAGDKVYADAFAHYQGLRLNACPPAAQLAEDLRRAGSRFCYIMPPQKSQEISLYDSLGGWKGMATIKYTRVTPNGSGTVTERINIDVHGPYATAEKSLRADIANFYAQRAHRVCEE